MNTARNSHASRNASHAVAPAPKLAARNVLDARSALWLLGSALLIAAGCASSSDSSGSVDSSSTLRPGIEDSSKAFKGQPTANETAFWEAVKNADNQARDAVIEQLKADVAKDSSNGYSQFLIGTASFMAPSATLKALADGTPVNGRLPDPSGFPYLEQGLTHLKDPFYLGFDATLLSSLQFGSGDIENGSKTFALALASNPVAAGLTSIVMDLFQKRDPAAGLADLYKIFDHCNGGPVDRNGADADAFVQKQNAGSLSHRECYSGYHAMHGSEGAMLIAGDLHALVGQTNAAGGYYAAAQKATNYGTWALKPLVERRVAGKQAADPNTIGVLVAGCETCHVSHL